MRAVLCCLAIATSLPAEESLNSSLVFHAGFDHGPDADFAAGDKQLFTAPDRKRTQPKPGLAAADGIELAASEGKFGGALAFRRKSKDLVFFKGGPNLGYREKNWSGSASFWLRLDPDRDLEPGYCDPVQFVAQAWGEGNMFVEFSKDHTPRHFRYAIMAVTKLWNPNNEKWEEMTRRPMVAVAKPPFTSERWTHVCFTFGNANTGAKDGWGRLYLDGVPAGEFRGWENTFRWDVTQSALTLGYSFTGLIDDIAVFNRALSDAEVKTVFALPQGIAGLHH